MKAVFAHTAVEVGSETLSHFEGLSALERLDVTSSRTLTLSVFLRRLTTSLLRAACPRTFTLSCRGTAASPTAGGMPGAIGALDALEVEALVPLAEDFLGALPTGTVAGAPLSV